MVFLLPGIRSKCDRVDEIEREVSSNKLIYKLLLSMATVQYNRMTAFYRVMLI